MHRMVVDVITGEVVHVELTPEEIAALPPPQPPPPIEVSFLQFILAARRLNFITHSEAISAAQLRIMPPAFVQALSYLPEEARMEAELRFAGMTRIVSSDPLMELVAQAGIATKEQLDGVFALAESIV